MIEHKANIAKQVNGSRRPNSNTETERRQPILSSPSLSPSFHNISEQAVETLDRNITDSVIP